MMNTCKISSQNHGILDRASKLLSSMYVVPNRTTYARDENIFCSCNAELHKDKLDVFLSIRDFNHPRMDWSRAKLILKSLSLEEKSENILATGSFDASGRLNLKDVPLNYYSMQLDNRLVLSIPLVHFTYDSTKVAAANLQSIEGLPERKIEVHDQDLGLTCHVTCENEDWFFYIFTYKEELKGRKVALVLERCGEQVFREEKKLKESLRTKKLWYSIFSIKGHKINNADAFKFFPAGETSLSEHT